MNSPIHLAVVRRRANKTQIISPALVTLYTIITTAGCFSSTTRLFVGNESDNRVLLTYSNGSIKVENKTRTEEQILRESRCCSLCREIATPLGDLKWAVVDERWQLVYPHQCLNPSHHSLATLSTTPLLTLVPPSPASIQSFQTQTAAYRRSLPSPSPFLTMQLDSRPKPLTLPVPGSIIALLILPPSLQPPHHRPYPNPLHTQFLTAFLSHPLPIPPITKTPDPAAPLSRALVALTLLEIILTQSQPSPSSSSSSSSPVPLRAASTAELMASRSTSASSLPPLRPSFEIDGEYFPASREAGAGDVETGAGGVRRRSIREWGAALRGKDGRGSLEGRGSLDGRKKKEKRGNRERDRERNAQTGVQRPEEGRVWLGLGIPDC